jgi:hypothetical protein
MSPDKKETQNASPAEKAPIRQLFAITLPFTAYRKSGFWSRFRVYFRIYFSEYTHRIENTNKPGKLAAGPKKCEV